MGRTITCNNCGSNLNVDLHADGFAGNVRECTKCGEIYTFKEDKRVIIKEGLKVLQE